MLLAVIYFAATSYQRYQADFLDYLCRGGPCLSSSVAV